MISTAVQDEWMNKLNFIYRKEQLVYVETLKNASTWALEVLSLNGFSPIKLTNIDWHQDHVFGFIQHPHRRRIKGIAEDLLTFYSVEQYLLNNLGQRFWLDHLTFGPHSVPLSLTWHSKIEMIDWIPIDVPQIDVVSILSKLFSHHNFEFKYDSDTYKHESDAYKKEISDQIKHMIGNGTGLLHLMLSRDEDLYNTVISNFNSQACNWPDITWLKTHRNN